MNISQCCSRIEPFKPAVCLTPRPGLAAVPNTDALELREPVLAAESRFLVEGLKLLHAASVRLEARKPITPLKEPLNARSTRTSAES